MLPSRTDKLLDWRPSPYFECLDRGNSPRSPLNPTYYCWSWQITSLPERRLPYLRVGTFTNSTLNLRKSVSMLYFRGYNSRSSSVLCKFHRRSNINILNKCETYSFFSKWLTTSSIETEVTGKRRKNPEEKGQRSVEIKYEPSSFESTPDGRGSERKICIIIGATF